MFIFAPVTRMKRITKGMIKSFRRAAVSVIIAAVCAAIFFSDPARTQEAEWGQGIIVKQVVVQGNQRMDDDTIRRYLLIRPGQPYDIDLANQSLKRLYSMGVFSDVKLEMRGQRLFVSVTENSIINQVVFEGNQKIADGALKDEIGLEPRSALTHARVQRAVQRILTLYNRIGRYGVRVEPKVVELPRNRVDLVFEIDEGQKTTISKINFVGNEAFSDSELMTRIMTSETGILSWFKSDDIYDPDRLAMDQELLRIFYLRNGYADFRVVSAVADLDQGRNKFIVTITVDEGERYRFGEINVKSSVSAIDPDMLGNFIKTYEGEVYNAELIEQSVEKVTLEMSRIGYAFSQLSADIQRDPHSKTISLTYMIEEGPRTYVERINIRGNLRTRDYVIRREFDFVEGDPYNRVMVERAQRSLKNLNLFKDVKIGIGPGSARDRVVINVDVKEKSTGQVSLSGGYSTLDGFLADVSVMESNLLGKGQYVRAAVSVSSLSTNISASFTEPYFLNRRLSFGVDAFSNQRDRDNETPYKNRRNGASVSLGFPLSSNIWFRTHAQLAQEEIFDVQDNASIAIQLSKGAQNVALIGYSLSYNTTDNLNDPKSGIYAQFRQDVAGLVLGDVKYVRTTAKVNVYQELYKNVVGIIKLQGGNIMGWDGRYVRILDSFFKGGEMIRGFTNSGIGPRDKNTGDALGGKWFAAATAEVQFPLLGISKELGFKGAVFADVGTLYETDVRELTKNKKKKLSVLDSKSLRSSIGASILWASPLGPLRADWAYVLSKESYDHEQLFRFGVETKF